MKRIGHIHVMSLVLAAFGIRFILISLIMNPWYILPIEVLSGLTYGMLTSTMNSYAALVAPPATESTMQGLVGSIFEGIGKFHFFNLSVDLEITTKKKRRLRENKYLSKPSVTFIFKITRFIPKVSIFLRVNPKLMYKNIIGKKCHLGHIFSYRFLILVV